MAALIFKKGSSAEVSSCSSFAVTSPPSSSVVSLATAGTSDAAATAGDLYMLNMDYLSLLPHKDENFRFDGFIKRDNQNAKTAKIFWMGVVASSNNRRHGKLDAITA